MTVWPGSHLPARGRAAHDTAILPVRNLNSVPVFANLNRRQFALSNVLPRRHDQAINLVADRPKRRSPTVQRDEFNSPGSVTPPLATSEACRRHLQPERSSRSMMAYLRSRRSRPILYRRRRGSRAPEYPLLVKRVRRERPNVPGARRRVNYANPWAPNVSSTFLSI